MSFLSPYGAVLRTPHARAAFASSLVGRLCYGIVSLSLLLTLTAGGRNYGFAGVVMALFGLAIVLASPFRARAIDQYGPRRVLPLLASCFAGVLIVLAVTPPGSGAADSAIAALATTAGASAPPLGVVMRTLWSRMIDDQDLLQAAYSLDGVAEELLYVGGPALVGVLTVIAEPSVGLWMTAGLSVSGVALFLRSPALRSWPAHPAQPPTRKPPSTDPGPAPGTAGSAIVTLAFAAGALGLCLGGLGLVTVAYCQARHDAAAVAWIDAALAAGSALGGLAYGAVAWRISPQRRLAVLVTGLLAVLMPAALSPNLLVLAAVADPGNWSAASHLVPACRSSRSPPCWQSRRCGGASSRGHGSTGRGGVPGSSAPPSPAGPAARRSAAGTRAPS